MPGRRCPRRFRRDDPIDPVEDTVGEDDAQPYREKRKRMSDIPGRAGAPGRSQIASAHPDWPKLNTHPRSIGVGDLRHRVLPRALTAPAHDEEVSSSRSNCRDRPPPLGRKRKRRGVPNETMATTVSSVRLRPIRSPCHATLSRPFRYRQSPTVQKGSPSSVRSRCSTFARWSRVPDQGASHLGHRTRPTAAH